MAVDMDYTFLFWNVSGDWESLAMRVKAEGYPVYIYRAKGLAKGREDTGVGIFDPEKDELVEDKYHCFNQFKDNKSALITIVDDNDVGEEADYLKSEGWTIIGAGKFGDEIEYKRDKGLELMEKIGLDVPFEQDFENIAEAVGFLKSEPPEARYVFKPNGSDFAGSSKTYTSKNTQDLIDYLKWIEADCKEKHYDVKKFVLQEFVTGIEADFSGYFNGYDFLHECCLIDIEEKKSGDGNKGEAVGCMGNIVFNAGKSKYFDDYIAKLADILREEKYVGPISINNIFASEDQGTHKKYVKGMPYGIEFTPRFGWDAHTTEMAILKKRGWKISDFYIALAQGKQFDFPTGLIGCGVRIYTGSISLKKDEVAGRYFSFEPDIMKNLWFYSVSKKNGDYMIEDNPVLVANAVSNGVYNAISDCYELIKEKLNLPDILYRNEIGERAPEVIKFLNQFNWIG